MYCPYCDMDFVEGVTICTDCSRPLIDKDEYLAAKKAELEQMKARAREEQEQMKAMQAAGAQNAAASQNAAPQREPDRYVKQSDRYEDLRSSATAFWIVGAALVVGSVLAFGKELGLPLSIPGNIITKAALVVMAVGSLCIAFRTTKDAQTAKGLISGENDKTKELIAWFLETFDAAKVDAAVKSVNHIQLSPEEMALERMRFITDAFIVKKNITNQAYADELAEEVYPKLFEE